MIKPVNPAPKKVSTIEPILAITSIPSQPVPKTTCESTPTDTNPPNTPATPLRKSPIVPKIVLTFRFYFLRF